MARGLFLESALEAASAGLRACGIAMRQTVIAHPVRAVQRSHLARFGWRRELVAQFLQDLLDLGDLLSVADRELALACKHAVRQADANIAAHKRRLRAGRYQVAAGREDAPDTVLAK